MSGRKSSDSDSNFDPGCLTFFILGAIYLLWPLCRFIVFLLSKIAELCSTCLSYLSGGARGLLDNLGSAIIGGLSLILVVSVVLFAPRLFRALDDFVYYVQNNILVCPKCHSVLKRVGVKCPSCNVVYDNLYPTFRHFFYMECANCGEKLATTRLLGRTKYESYCLECHSPLGVNASEGKVVAIPIAGGRASGKTTFLMSSLKTLACDYPLKKKWSASFPYRESERNAKYLNDCFSRGITPDQTRDLIPRAFCIDYKAGRLRESIHLCVYDPAGESFSGAYEELKKSGYYDFISGLIFIVDPFSLPALRQWRQRSLAKEDEDFDASDVDPTTCVERLVHRFEEQEKPDREIVESEADADDSKFRDVVLKPLKELPCAIVLTKTDGYDLDRFIGEEGVENFRKRYPQFDDEEAMDQVCRYWLKRWGGQNVLGVLENKFGQTRCFAVSALGKKNPRDGYSGGFHPYNIDAPFNWILDVSGTRGLNKWGVLIFLFGVFIAISAILSLAFYLATSDSSRSADSIDSSASSSRVAPEAVAIWNEPTPRENAAASRFRPLRAKAFDESVKSATFGFHSVVSPFDAVNRVAPRDLRDELDARFLRFLQGHSLIAEVD